MSVDSPDANASASDAGSSDYDQMLTTLDTAIKEDREKIESGRVYDAENERVRIKWIRALAYAVNVRRQVTNDRELTELAERIEALEAAESDTPQDGEEPVIDFNKVDT